MKNYLHSKQFSDMIKAGIIGPNEIKNYIMNDGLPYPGVFSFPDEIIEPIELAANRRGRENMIRDYDVKEKTR